MLEPCVRILVVDAPHFYAAALWRKNGSGTWECYHAAPIVRYLVGMSAKEAKRYITKKNWKYEWV